MSDPTSLLLFGLSGVLLGVPLGRWVVDTFFPARPRERYFTIFEDPPPQPPAPAPPPAPLMPAPPMALADLLARLAASRTRPPTNFRIVEQSSEDRLPGLRCWICGEPLRDGQPHPHDAGGIGG
jgi:hypothetical protein